MIVTCFKCPRQLCFAGPRDLMLLRFGWSIMLGRCYCPECWVR